MLGCSSLLYSATACRAQKDGFKILPRNRCAKLVCRGKDKRPQNKCLVSRAKPVDTAIQLLPNCVQNAVRVFTKRTKDKCFVFLAWWDESPPTLEVAVAAFAKKENTEENPTRLMAPACCARVGILKEVRVLSVSG